MPSGDDDETAPRCAALPCFGERLTGDFRAGARLAGELLARELLASELLARELLGGALLVRAVLFRALWAACVFLECRTFIRLKLSTVIDGTRAEPASIRPSVAMHMRFAARTHASGGANLSDIDALLPGFNQRYSDKPDCSARRDARHAGASSRRCQGRHD